MSKKSFKINEFNKLVDNVVSCNKCHRMKDSARILSHASGNIDAEIMFIGEAPGRHGADRTQIPFHGDAAGNNFEELLDFAGINRSDIYITNCVLCNPKDDKGNNSTPTGLEIENCSNFLRRQIELVDPRIIVTLGATPLKALTNIENHKLSLKENVRSSINWFGRLLIPLYHPGQRAMIHRSKANQRSDYQFIVDTLKKLSGRKLRSNSPTRSDVLAACRYLLQQKGEVSYFELHKLAYLAEYLHVKETGKRLTKAYFIRQKDGPYCVDLNLNKLKNADPNINIAKRKNKLFISLHGAGMDDLFDKEEHLDSKVKRTLDNVLKRYSYPNDAELKRAVYLTAPMRMILRSEKVDGDNLFNTPINFLAV